MAKKYATGFPPVANLGPTDQFQVVQAGADGDATLQQVYDAFPPGLTATITTSTTLSTPIPHTVFLAPVDGAQTLTIPALTAANGARLGDHIAIINNGNFEMALNYSNGSIIPGSVVTARQIRVYAIETLGTPGVLTVVERLGSIRDQDFDDVSLSGGAINNTTIGLLTPTAGKFSTITAAQPSGFTDANAIQQVAGVQTTNATPTVLASVVVNQTESITLSGTITAAQSDHTNAVGGSFSITARRASGGNVTLIGSVVTNVQSSSTATFTCAVDTGTQTVRILVTGVAVTTYNWAANYTYQKILTNT